MPVFQQKYQRLRAGPHWWNHAFAARHGAWEFDPEALARLARKRLRGKIPVLRQIAAGTMNEHHRFLLEQWLAHWDELTERIAKFDERVDEFRQDC